MLSCTQCFTVFAPGAPVTCPHCHGEVSQATKPQKQTGKGTCELCRSLLVGRKANTRFCSTTCRSRAIRLFKDDPATYAQFAPRYERPDLKARHAETQKLKELGALPKNAHPLSSTKLKDPTELMWALINADTPDIKLHNQDKEAIDASVTPTSYLLWRNKQPWAKPSTLAEQLKDVADTPLKTTEGFSCTCIACDKAFTAPFQADLCPECL